MIKKIVFTFKDLKKTAYHHYGSNSLSIPKFLYYSLLRVNTFIVFERNLSQEIPTFDPDPRLKVIKPTPKELDKIRKGKNLPREFYYDTVHNVRTCFMAQYENEIAHIHWVYFKGDRSRFLEMGDEAAEINYVTTLPKFRGNRLSARMIAGTLSYLREMGYKKAIVICHEENPPMIKTAKLSGFKEVRRIKALGPLNRKFTC